MTLSMSLLISGLNPDVLFSLNLDLNPEENFQKLQIYIRTFSQNMTPYRRDHFETLLRRFWYSFDTLFWHFFDTFETNWYTFENFETVSKFILRHFITFDTLLRKNWDKLRLSQNHFATLLEFWDTSETKMRQCINPVDTDIHAFQKWVK